MSEEIELLIGSDFGAPMKAGEQAKKTIAIEAFRTAVRRYEILATGRNERLVRQHDDVQSWSYNRRGWTIPGLAKSIRNDPTIAVAAFDFPFSVPLHLLQDEAFAGKVNEPVFGTRLNWVQFVGQHVGLAFGSDNAGAKLPIDDRLFRWKDKDFWKKRATDIATSAHPPLKHKFQNLFNMTVIGSKFLECLQHGGMQILLRQEEDGRRLHRAVIETYPGAIARAVGFRRNYKQEPERCLAAAEEYLREQGITLVFNGEVRRFCLEYRTNENDPEGADAFLCLVTAICFREGLAEWHKGPAKAQQLDEEGCIVTPARHSSSVDCSGGLIHLRHS